jgi:hypothetical protein
VIIASNQQNKVDQESFWALDPIHKSIEIYFDSKTGDERLYYERRPGQFNTIAGIEKVRIVTKDLLLKVYASVFLEQPNQVGRYYKDLTPLIGKEIFSPNHDVHSYYTAAYIAYRLEFIFRNRKVHPEWKPFRFQLAMAARLILERELKLDPKKKRAQAYCAPIDAIMADPDKALAVFEAGSEAIKKAIKELSALDAKLDRRTAKMRDMRDKLRSLIVGAPPLPADVAAPRRRRDRMHSAARRQQDAATASLRKIGAVQASASVPASRGASQC